MGFNEIGQSNDITTSEKILELETISIPFIENVGYIHNDKIKYYANTFAGSVYVTDDEVTYLSNAQNNTRWITKEVFLDGNIDASGYEKSDTVVNYFKGESKDWKTKISTFETITLGQVWPLIQVDLKAHDNNVEKIFTVFPGADISTIKIRFDGISKLNVDSNGYLVTNTDGKETIFSKPVAYQLINGQKIHVPVTYSAENTTYGFDAESYDLQFPLVIDPLIASTFIGASAADAGNDIVVDSSGNVYITGDTNDVAVDFPTTVGAYDTTENGSTDVFVSKFNSGLTSLSASTFIGGSSSDTGYSIALDNSGNVYITGKTNDGTTDFPTTVGAFNGTHGGITDVFVSKFNSDLSSLSASTLIGGSGSESGYGISLDSSGNVYITGETNAATNNFPTTVGAYDTTHNSATGTPDVFVSKFNSGLTSLSASTFIGGSGGDIGESIVVDSSGNVYITGHTPDAVTNYPVNGSAYDTTHNGSDDIFVSKFNSGLSSLLVTTFLGGGSSDYGYDIALDNSNNVYITGYTDDGATDLATTVGAYDTTHNGLQDAFVSKFNNGLSSLLASTYIGGSGADYGYGITVDSSNNVYITGRTFDSSTDLPTTTGAYDTTHNGSDDVFVSKFNSTLSSLSASTFLGGGSQDYGNAVAVDSSGNIYITGLTTDTTTDLPVTSGAYDTTQNGDTDAFVSKFDSSLSALSSSVSDTIGIVATIQTTKSSSSTFSSTGTVSAGGEFSVTLPQNTAGSTNTVTVDYPSGVSATTTVSTTTQGSNTASTIKFLGQVLDVSISGASSSSFTYQIRFTFTDADLSASGITLNQVRIFHDSNENGSFEENEAKSTTVTTISSGNYRAAADVSSNSKFAVGGVVPTTSANAAAGIGAVGGLLGFLKDNCDESGFGNGESLRVYEIRYDKCDANQITILAYSTCGPIKAQIAIEGNRNIAGMTAEQPYLNDEKRMIKLASSIPAETEDFSVIINDKRDDFYEKIIADKCENTKQYQFTTGYTSKQITAGVLVPTWIKNNAEWWAQGQIDDSTFVDGIRYLIKENILTVPDTQTEESDATSMPTWIKNNAEWWAQGQIDDSTFVDGIQYLVKKGIVDIR